MRILQKPLPHRATVRKILNELFPASEDFESFCIDFFGEIYSRFGVSIDRVSKTNLLLVLAGTDEIIKCLYTKFRKTSSKINLIQNYLDNENNFYNAETRQLRNKLQELYTERELCLLRKKSVVRLNNQIVDIKRLLRQGPQLNEGEVLEDRFLLIEIIGYGGFAKVWQAFDQELRRLVAVKILHSDLSSGSTSLSRFQRGAKQMMKLTHPHIVRVLLEPKEYEGFHYFVMEYLHGGNLHNAILNQPMNIGRSLQAVIQAGMALHHAHNCGMIHRDVKPHNILLDTNGFAQLCDFDLVWAPDTTGGTRTGAMGTFIYAAPEQLEGSNNIDNRADIFSLGMTALFAIYGKQLPSTIFGNQISFINKLHCNDGIKSAISTAIQWEANRRYSTILEFVQVLSIATRMAGLNLDLSEVSRQRSQHLQESSFTQIAELFSEDSSFTQKRFNKHTQKLFKSKLQLLILFIIIVFSVPLGNYMLSQREKAIFARKLNERRAEIDEDLINRNWGDAIAHIEIILKEEKISDQVRKDLTESLAMASMEKIAAESYSKFLLTEDDLEAIQFYEMIPEKSFYKRNGEVRYRVVLEHWTHENVTNAVNFYHKRKCLDFSTVVAGLALHAKQDSNVKALLALACHLPLSSVHK